MPSLTSTERQMMSGPTRSHCTLKSTIGLPVLGLHAGTDNGAVVAVGRILTMFSFLHRCL